MASKYEIDALAKARTDGVTAADVAALDYRGTAALCAVKVEANGNSPADFFYVNVRRYVASTLKIEEDEAAELATKTAIEAKLTPDEQVWLDKKVSASLSAEALEVSK